MPARRLVFLFPHCNGNVVGGFPLYPTADIMPTGTSGEMELQMLPVWECGGIFSHRNSSLEQIERSNKRSIKIQKTIEISNICR